MSKKKEVKVITDKLNLKINEINVNCEKYYLNNNFYILITFHYKMNSFYNDELEISEEIPKEFVCDNTNCNINRNDYLAILKHTKSFKEKVVNDRVRILNEFLHGHKEPVSNTDDVEENDNTSNEEITVKCGLFVRKFVNNNLIYEERVDGNTNKLVEMWEYDKNNNCIGYTYRIDSLSDIGLVFDSKKRPLYMTTTEDSVLCDSSYYTYKYDGLNQIRLGDKITETGLYNGVPITIKIDGDIDAILITELNTDDILNCINFINNTFRLPNDNKNRHKWCDMNLRKMIQDELNISLTYNQIKHLMLICGYEGRLGMVKNNMWYYNIAKR